MGFLSRVFGLERKSDNSGLDDLLRAIAGTQTAAGENVNPDTAMRCTTVFACVRILSESVAQLPLHLYERTSTGGKERATNHALSPILGIAANDWTPSFDFKLSMTVDLTRFGNSYAFINRVGGQIVELIQLPADAVKVTTDARTREPSYTITQADGSQAVYDRQDIFHLRLMGTKPNIGDSPIDRCREAIGLSLVLERFAGAVFRRGAFPSGFISVDGKLGQNAKEQIAEFFARRYAGAANAGGTPIFDQGAKFERTQFSSVDMQFLELRRYQVAEISRAFRVPLHLLNDLERATHNNAESMGRQFLSFTLLPYLKAWESAIKLQLIDQEERGRYFAEFMVDDIVRADLAARFEALSKAIGKPWLTPDEGRALDNRPPIPGGDRLAEPLNMTTAGGGDA